MQRMNFSKRWVIVTGASSGLGAEMARILAFEHGANLVLTARREDRLLELKKEIQSVAKVEVVTIPADLSQIDDTQRFFDLAVEGREIYGAILNAGITHFGHWDELSFDQFLQMQAVNNTCVVKLATLLVPYLEKQGHNGGIELVASMAGVVPVPFQTHYSATKAFLVHFGACLHHEMSTRGVSVTTFVPGGIVTEMTEGQRFNDLRGWLMPVRPCAREGVEALMKRRYIHSPGMLYRFGGAITKLLPQRLFVSQVANQYRKSLAKHS